MGLASKKGFTLIEVLLAVAIVGIVLTPILMLQSMIVRNTRKNSQKLTRIFEAKNFLLDSELALASDADQSSAQKKITNPSATLKYELSKVTGESSLKKIKNLYRQQVTIEWQEQGKNRKEKIVSFIYRPESKR